MTLAELDRDEQIALVALLGKLLVADGGGSDGEGRKVAEVVTALGQDAYDSAFEEAQDRYQEIDELKALLRRIGRQDARELIFATLMDVSIVDGMRSAEADLLEWLEAEWRIEVKPPPQA